MVLDNVPQAQALDDVFWMAVYNLALGGGSGDGADTRRFYDVLLPFLTGKTPRPGLQSLGQIRTPFLIRANAESERGWDESLICAPRFEWHRTFPGLETHS